MNKPIKVRCERDNTTFKPVIQKDPSGALYINCPTCCRGYYLEEDEIWRADRPLTILETEIDAI